MSTRTSAEHDLAELTDVLKLVRDEDEPCLPWPFVYRLKGLIGCDNLTFLGLDSPTLSDYFSQSLGEEEWYDDGPSPGSPDEDGFASHYWDCPPCNHPETSRDHTRVTKVSDFYSAREWHSTGMYADNSRPRGHEHEMMMWLPDGPGRTVRLLCCRGPGRDFGERERLLLALLRPHIAEAYRNAVGRAGPAPLTPRQLELLVLVREGCTNRQIGRRLGVSEGTVRTHLNNIFERLGVNSRTAAVARGLERLS